MASPALPKLDALAKLNVRRLSAGAGLSKIVYKHLARLAETFLKEGDCALFSEPSFSHAELQNLFAPRR